MAATNYKRLDQQIRDAIQNLRNGNGSLYDVATWCIKLFGESDSYAEAVGISGDEVLNRLNEYLRDFAVDLSNLMAIMKHFPRREQWDRPLLDLLDDTNKAIRAASKDDHDHAPITRRRVTLKEVESLTAELKDARWAASKAISELDQAKARIAELEAENAKLLGRVEQLEKMVRTPAMA